MERYQVNGDEFVCAFLFGSGGWKQGEGGSNFGADRLQNAVARNFKPILGGWQGYP